MLIVFANMLKQKPNFPPCRGPAASRRTGNCTPYHAA